MRSFLVTTADQRFWKENVPLVFLGEWCRLYDQRSAWSEREHKVVDYHWNDRTALSHDRRYLDILYERSLSELVPLLNEIHGTEYPSRYWRILIGPWLYTFISALYDRYRCIEAALGVEKSLSTAVPAHLPGCFTPHTFFGFFQSLKSDAYNFFLFGSIIRFLGTIPYDEIAPHHVDEKTSGVPPKNGLALRKFVGLALSRLRWILPSRWKRFVFIATSLPKTDLLWLQLGLGQFPCGDSIAASMPPVIFSKEMRSRFSLLIANGGLSAKTSFESLLQLLISDQIPLAYLEGYSALQKSAGREFPSEPRVIVTSDLSEIDDSFKLWTAKQVAEGAKLVIVQHGGHYGTGWCQDEKHEIEICDKYFTWGWDEIPQEKIRPLPASKLVRATNSVQPTRGGSILLVLNSWPRYFYRLFSSPMSSQVLCFLQDQVRFLDALSEQAYGLTEVRTYPIDYGWNTKERLKEHHADLKFAETGVPLLEQLSCSRLFVGTHNTTTYLETMAANYPTVVFWEPTLWEIRPTAQPYFDALRRAGILHSTPESAAAKVNEIYEDTDRWWRSASIQRTRERFCSQFARTDKNWKMKWINELKLLDY